MPTSRRRHRRAGALQGFAKGSVLSFFILCSLRLPSSRIPAATIYVFTSIFVGAASLKCVSSLPLSP